MRLDKWLKLSRIIKRRTVAQMACDQGRVFVNERTAKSATTIKPDDVIHLELGSKALTFRVLCVPEKNITAAEAGSLYEILAELKRKPEILEWLPEDF